MYIYINIYVYICIHYMRDDAAGARSCPAQPLFSLTPYFLVHHVRALDACEVALLACSCVPVHAYISISISYIYVSYIYIYIYI